MRINIYTIFSERYSNITGYVQNLIIYVITKDKGICLMCLKQNLQEDKLLPFLIAVCYILCH